jgi:hypothetical protein
MRAARKRQDRDAAKKSTMSEEEQVWACAAGMPLLLQVQPCWECH